MARQPRTKARSLLTALILAGILLPAHAVEPPVQPVIQPHWAELSVHEKQILAPLSKDWNGMEAWRRKKWLDIANRYPGLTPDERIRLQGQMKAWAGLTPEQRQEAREKYRNVQKATPVQKEALKQMWSEYQTRQKPVKSAPGK